MFWIFPTLVGVNHFALSAWSSFYSAFDFTQKTEYLAWMNTVFFQTSFTILRFMYPQNPFELSKYFLMYILHDTAHLLFYDHRPMYYVHHALAILLSYMSRWMSYHHALEIMNAAAFLEASNILLGTAWLLNRAGYGAHIGTKILGGFALVAYILLRNVFFPSYLFLYTSYRTQLLLAAFIPMNLYWSWKLVAFVRRIGKPKSVFNNDTEQTKRRMP